MPLSITAYLKASYIPDVELAGTGPPLTEALKKICQYPKCIMAANKHILFLMHLKSAGYYFINFLI